MDDGRVVCWFCEGAKQLAKLGMMRDCRVCGGTGTLPPGAGVKAAIIRKCACGAQLTGDRLYACVDCSRKRRQRALRHPE